MQDKKKGPMEGSHVAIKGGRIEVDWVGEEEQLVRAWSWELAWPKR